MATITFDGLRAETERKHGFFARLLDRMVEAQTARARSVAKPHLEAMSDEELRNIGYTREEIERWPSGARWI